MARLDGLVRWIQRCNTPEYQKGFLPFLCQQRRVGYIKPSFAEHLSRYPQVFTVSKDHVSVNTSLRTAHERTVAAAALEWRKSREKCKVCDKEFVNLSLGTACSAAFTEETAAGVLAELRDAGMIPGWRNELYAVTDSFHQEPYMLIERAAAVPFGIKSYGVHMNGYVKDSSGKVKLWVARRAKTKQTWPGMLDHLCAGGQPHGVEPTANMIKEAAEEASIDESIAKHVKPAGAVSYCQVQKDGLKRDCLFVYDLELSPDFHPKPADGEVESFELMDIDKVADLISKTNEFKDNCNLVIIDFMVRHGVIKPEDSGYLDIVSGLRQQDCA